ncbi:hypothetical protein ACS0PU_001778 [Formica fusca]
MIKLFLITLLCATLVFADLPVQGLQDVREGQVNGFLGMADHLGRGSSLVRRSAQGGGGQGGAGGGFGGHMGGGAGGGAGAGGK